jgi:Uma2 family endonuclease
MSAKKLISVEEYLRYSDKPNCDYRDGVMYPKAWPTTFHSLIQFEVVRFLLKQGLDAALEVTVRLSETKYLVPDVIAAERLKDPYPLEPVLICCEILSPEEQLSAMLAKCEEYHAWGVPFCWVIDPVKRSAWEFHAGMEPVRVAEELRAGEFRAEMVELFSALDDVEG